jgi:hypothetical protein
MINGVVNARLEPTVQLVIHDATGQPHDVEVVVVSAYNGFLTLPPPEVAALALPLGNPQQVRLATAFLQGHELRVKFVVGGSVTIEALP